MKLVLVFLLFEFFFVSHAKPKDDFLSLVESFGYKGEAHKVETEDGYILTVHRIFSTQKNNNTLEKYPVFLMHGLFVTSGDFVISGPKRALAFLLADNGFDVWLGNARGNKYSTNHRNLSTEAPEFWDFSFHEIGFYDLPAMIDFMLKETNSSKAFYVGHSQGTTSLMVLLSTRPEYNDKIIQAHLLAPAVFFETFGHPIAKYLKPEIKNGFFGGYSYLNFQDFWSLGKSFRDNFCKKNQTKKEVFCPGLVCVCFYLFGANKVGVEMDTNILKILEYHVSPRVSIKQIEHFSQLIFDNKFVQFDFKDGNLQRYNSTSPPAYELSNVKAEVYLYHGGQDLFCRIKDIKHAKEVLPNVKLLRTIPNWNHCDFNYGKRAGKVLYKDILNSFKTVV